VQLVNIYSRKAALLWRIRGEILYFLGNLVRYVRDQLRPGVDEAGVELYQ